MFNGSCNFMPYYTMADIGSEARLLSLGESDTETLVRRNKASRELMVTTIQSSHLRIISFIS